MKTTRSRQRKTKIRQPESAARLSLAQLKADPERLITQHEAVGFLGKSPSWFERNRWARTGPSYTKVGRSVYYRALDLIAFVEGNVVETTGKHQHQPQPSA